MSSGLAVVPFEPGHLAALELRPADGADMAGLDLAGLAGTWAGHPAWTVLDGTRVVACYGAVVRGGTATLWALTSREVERHPLRATRTGRALVRWLTGPMGCHRVEALVHVGNVRSRRWLARMLGLRCEGLLRASGPNRQDRFLMAATGGRQ